jgi:monothiol glutaredoxin
VGLLGRIGKKLNILGGRREAPPKRDLSSYSPPPREEEEPDPVSPRKAGQPVQEFIAETVKGNAVVLFMKGTPDAPRCGFSANAASILRSTGKPFHAVDVLSDEEIRDGVKVYSSWPTLPQVFVNGEFVGGADILAQLHQSGELQKLLDGAATA